jgi:hypothetical protein
MSVKRYDGLDQASFFVLILGFCIKVCYNLYHNMLELATIWNIG